MVNRPADPPASALLALIGAGGPDVERLSLPGGAVLFEEGDNTGRIFVLATGRLAAVQRQAGRQPRFLGVIAPGEAIGEIAFLTDKPHGATVVALRDSQVLAMPRDVFAEAINREPALMLEMARLAVRRTTGGGDLSGPRVFGLVGVQPGPPVRALAEQLAAVMSGYGDKVAILDSTEQGRASDWYARFEAGHKYVLYVGAEGESDWIATCVRQADRLMLVGAGDRAPPEQLSDLPALETMTLKPVDLVLVQPADAARPVGTAAWRGAISAARLAQVKNGDAEDIARLARRLTRRSVGLTLSGGGARGYAHLGAIRALREAGVPIDSVCGTSMGAVIGACAAMDWDNAEIDHRIRKAFVEADPLDDVSFPLLAMTRGRKVDERLAEHFGGVMIEDLWLPYFCVSSDLTRGVHHIHDRGALDFALRASIALPGILPPSVLDGRVLVDGGVLRNLPADLMRAVHAGPIIAVDVSRDLGMGESDLQLSMSFLSWVFGGHWRRGMPIVSLLMRSATVTAGRDLALAREASDVYVAPHLSGVEIRDWKAIDAAAAAGYEATMRALDGLDRPVSELKIG